MAQFASIGLIGVLIGWHAMSLSVALAGLGVGQVAFDQLFIFWLIPDRKRTSQA